MKKTIRKRYSCRKCHHQHNTSSKICREHHMYLKTPENNRLNIPINDMREKDMPTIILSCRDLDQYQILLDEKMILIFSEQVVIEKC